MSPYRRPSRGLSDIRTLTGRSDTRIPVHKAYLRISFLELERARRKKEMEAARDRIEAMSSRFRAIDSEISDILANVAGTDPPARPVVGRHREPVGRRPAKRNFRLTY